jgi:hypothetical protein
MTSVTGTLFTGPGLLLSLPGAEVERIGWAGSIVAPGEILAAPVSPDLRAAVRLVWGEALRRGMAMHCIARPELFADGPSRRWLQARAPGITQHLCLSDGSAIKPLAGLQTHVFFYQLGHRANMQALARLCRRAGELMAQVASQVNTHLALGDDVDAARPASVLLHAATPLEHPPPVLLPLFYNCNSDEDSANRTEQAGPVAAARLTDAARLNYLPLTETALDDRAFARVVARTVLDACFDPACLLVLRLPAGGGERTPAQRIAAMLPALRQSGIVIPRASPDNIVLATEDLDEDHTLPARLPRHLLVHDSFDFWRHTPGFYAGAEQVTVVSGREAASPPRLPYDVRDAYGPQAVRRRIDAAA